MAFKLHNRVHETSTTGGSGAQALAGAVSGRKSFASRLVAADTTFGTLHQASTNKWVTGLLTFTQPGSVDTITVTTVFESSEGLDAMPTFTAAQTIDVFIDLPAFSALPAADKARMLDSMGALGGAFGFRNRLINPSGRLWQRQNSGAAAITDGTYAFDRFYGLTQSNGVTASQVTNAENGTPYLMRLAQANASAQRFGLAQLVETDNIIDLRGQAVTLSARVRMSASTTLRFAIVEWTGTSNSVTRDFVNDWTNGTFTAGQFFTSTTTTITATGSKALTANTFDTINLTGVLGGSANNVAVMFWTDSTQAQNVTLDIGKVQLERGYQATALALRSLQVETSLCQRYYYKTYLLSTAPGTATFDNSEYMIVGGLSGNLLGRSTALPVEMLGNPTFTFYSPNSGSSGVIFDGSNNADVSVSVLAGSNRRNVQWRATASGGVGALSMFAHFSAVAEL